MKLTAVGDRDQTIITVRDKCTMEDIGITLRMGADGH